MFGTITCQETGQSIPGAWIIAELQSVQANPNTMTSSDAKGEYRLALPIVHGSTPRYRLIVRSRSIYHEFDSGDPRVAETLPSLAPFEEKRHDVALVRGVGIDLNVRWENGLPVDEPNARLVGKVPIQHSEFWDNLGNGSLATGGLDPEIFPLREMTLHVWKGNQGKQTPLNAYPLVNGRMTVDVFLPMGASIRGRVLGPDLKPCDGKRYYGILILYSTSGANPLPLRNKGGCGYVDIQSDGTFLIEGIRPESTSICLMCTDPHDAVMSKPITVVPGQDVTITLEKGEEVFGRVLDASGKPLSGVTVEGYFEGEGGQESGIDRVAITGADGRYLLKALPSWPGLKVEAVLAGGKPEESERQFGWTDVRVGQEVPDIVIGQEPEFRPCP